MARQIRKILNCKEPKTVNGPEILNKFVGASEENIRKLFVDAEKEWLKKTTALPFPLSLSLSLSPSVEPERIVVISGEDSELHLIIFDEIDAICKLSTNCYPRSTGLTAATPIVFFRPTECLSH